MFVSLLVLSYIVLIGVSELANSPQSERFLVVFKGRGSCRRLASQLGVSSIRAGWRSWSGLAGSSSSLGAPMVSPSWPSLKDGCRWSGSPSGTCYWWSGIQSWLGCIRSAYILQRKPSFKVRKRLRFDVTYLSWFEWWFLSRTSWSLRKSFYCFSVCAFL